MWGLDAFGLPIHDNWWQTETGGIMIGELRGHGREARFHGPPAPGIEAAVGGADLDRGTVRPVGAGQEGELALRPGWPSCSAATWGGQDATARVPRTGGTFPATSAHGCGGVLLVVGRADDVIKSAGHLIGPFEVEKRADGAPAGRGGRGDRASPTPSCTRS